MAESAEQPLASLEFLYCGHGDTILVGSDACWGLVDCHLTKSSGAHARIRDWIEERGIRRLDFVCLTHPDRDHCFGMRKLLEECFCDNDGVRFSEFWDAGIPSPLMLTLDMKLHRGRPTITRGIRGLYEELLVPLARQDRFAWRSCQQGFEAYFGQFRLRAIGPKRNAVERWKDRLLDGREPWGRAHREESNDLSVVLVLSHRQLPVHFLLGGDATTRAWMAALEYWRTESWEEADTRFSGVKISHHGALSGHYPPLYELLCRREKTVGVLSVGPDYELRPDAQVMRDLTRFEIPVFATCWPQSSERGLDGLPLPGEPLDDHPFPREGSGFGWNDVRVTICCDGQVVAKPPEALLRLSGP